MIALFILLELFNLLVTVCDGFSYPGTVQPGAVSEYTCKYARHGAAYQGEVARTIDGHTCQRWDSQLPHSHPYLSPDRLHQNTLQDAHNYCRNPDHHDRTGGPWCLTTDPEVEWQYCDVPFCKELTCKSTVRGLAYAGNVSTTVSGRTCQRWDSRSPHRHRFDNIATYPDDTLAEAGNFCRNPKGRPSGPWCFTTDPDKRWEYCDIPICPPPEPFAGYNELCKGTGMGSLYRGSVNMTVGGEECQRWDSQTPHSHNRNKPSLFPDETLEDAANYCRNPDDEPFGPWCYTTDPDVRWNYCNISHCSDIICEDTFSRLEESHAEGGVAFPQFDGGVGLCLAGCLRRPECRAVDFYHGKDVSPRNTRCYFHLRSSQIEKIPTRDVDLYLRQGCGPPEYHCSDMFVMYVAHHAEGATPHDVFTLDECQSACLDKDSCLGLDWDRTSHPWHGYRCWLHLDVIQIEPEPSTYHFPRLRCSDFLYTRMHTNANMRV